MSSENPSAGSPTTPCVPSPLAADLPKWVKAYRASTISPQTKSSSAPPDGNLLGDCPTKSALSPSFLDTRMGKTPTQTSSSEITLVAEAKTGLVAWMGRLYRVSAKDGWRVYELVDEAGDPVWTVTTDGGGKTYPRERPIVAAEDFLAELGPETLPTEKSSSSLSNAMEALEATTSTYYGPGLPPWIAQWL